MLHSQLQISARLLMAQLLTNQPDPAEAAEAAEAAEPLVPCQPLSQ